MDFLECYRKLAEVKATISMSPEDEDMDMDSEKGREQLGLTRVSDTTRMISTSVIHV